MWSCGTAGRCFGSSLGSGNRGLWGRGGWAVVGRLVGSAGGGWERLQARERGGELACPGPVF